MKRNALLFLVLCLGWGPAGAAVNVQQNPDGSYYTSVVYKGAPAEKYDIVFIGDGFTASQQAIFNNAVATAVEALKNMTPYRERKLCWANVWRVNVVSQQSGVDHPKDGVYKNTALDCHYGNPPSTPERLISSSSPAKCYEAASYAPAYDAVFVLVNDPQWGGAAGDLVYSSIHPGDPDHPFGFSQIITHELGHKIGLLADEYPYYLGADIDGGQTYYGGEPSKVNLTIQTNPTLIKWKDLIAPTTPLPTVLDSPMGVVGLWEGGGYKAYGIYRPQKDCQMRDSKLPFCDVCERELRNRLYSHCADCDIQPVHPECLFLDLRKYLLLQTRFWCKFPLPNCPLCPTFDLFNQVDYFLDGAPPDSLVMVTDELGQVVAESRAVKGPVHLRLNANVAKQYQIQVISGEVSPNGVELVSALFVNGAEQQLAE